MCNCLKDVDNILKPSNTELDIVFSLDNELPARAKVATLKIDKTKQRGPASMVATFCPFCGTKYEAKKPDNKPVEGG